MQNLSGKRTELYKQCIRYSLNKKAVRKNEKIPEVRFLAVFFNQSHVCRKNSAGDGIFFRKTVADV